ncbi:DUF4174 domain-containing protein [Fulvimarina sp. 2208YS6-2-32]|uniref:DUF4174 domain-containing protein n=1 Tax=Fulvimarina uroteuthidis TaxID=3098149 RepID=A0ABU5I832_9HYPH|nr:DUF4174 domain-containing protein [Fulvimarina sp. 2208YS6-2-32]MDY8110978.1 DUF4174 domain-containing protein [Fulvimarina sp. 2208YS6-2-32]
MKQVLLSAVFLAATLAPALAGPLEPYRWNARPLLVFAPDLAGRDVTRQLATFDAAMAGLETRDMAVLLVLASRTRPSMLSGQPKPGAGNAALRAAYGIDPGAFAVILVGKDGDEKNRWTHAIDPAEIFDQVDGMPMRMREMRTGG